jgi:peptidoglycan/LPS O-acetylase OafA/YrhL
LQQLVTLDTGDGVSPENHQHAEWALSERAPHAMARFRAAAQQRDRFDFTAINRVEVPIALAASALMPILVVLLRRRRPALAALALSATLALLANAAICGIFSAPSARYQSRLAPIAPLAALIAVLDLRRRSRQQPDTVPG